MSFVVGLGAIVLMGIGAARVAVLGARAAKRALAAVRHFVAANLAGLRRATRATRRAARVEAPMTPHVVVIVVQGPVQPTSAAEIAALAQRYARKGASS